MTGTAGYNQNIQMLRGVAVLLVLGFHLQLGWFAWGYLGVDLFFLVSGFLMPLILPKYSAGTFLLARVKRIYPALLAAIAVSFALGWVTMMPGEMDAFSQSGLAAIFSVSEFWFAANTGYFDEPRQTNPLLHTWSLGVEFLCYALVALGLLVSGSEKLRERLALGGAVASALAFLAMWWVQGDQISYFNPLPRMALFLFAFWVSARRWTMAPLPALGLTVAGIALLAVLFADELLARVFPSPAVFLLVPVGLPMMMLARPVPLPRLLGAPLRWLGDISYSLYIWHWPVITFQMLAVRNFDVRLWEAPILAAISLVAAAASYYLIERNGFLRRTVVIAVAAAVLGLGATVGIATNGFTFRWPAVLAPYASLEIMRDRSNAACRQEFAGLGFHLACSPATEDTVMILGDSHARHFMPLFAAAEPETRTMRLSATAGELAEVWSEAKRAADEAGASRVYVAFRWYNEDADGVRALLAAMAADPLPQAVLVRDIPAYTFNVVACWVNQHAIMFYGFCGHDLGKPLPLDVVQNATEGNWALAAATDLPQIDTHGPFCDAEGCRVLRGDTLLYRDTNHLHERLDTPVQLWLYEQIFAADRQRAD
ncbi:acyltransferase family protein [Aurantiacibacter sp. MUD11]|uniref:acyltransferase family protein n=1 Tax=Aurantiacibacter sp. MUD11 TaxID=3003265 RepID=UPI0022AAC326|nr:acyltransferase family protein [Aurantiacibacter sp. MUD11]WAT17012.1 acyltransferase family protein [Aurantiacibacter sp. MUD11]